MRRLSLGSLVAVLVLTVPGCGDDPETAAEPTPSSSAADGGSGAAASPSATPTSEPSASPAQVEPSVAPATGAQLNSEIISVRAPAEFGDNATQRDYGGTVFQVPNLRFFLELNAETSTLEAETPDELIALKGRDGVTGQPMERLPDVVIDGQPAYHRAGPDPAFDGWRDEFAFRYRGYEIIISINSELDTPQAQRDATNAAVLASAELLQ